MTRPLSPRARRLKGARIQRQAAQRLEQMGYVVANRISRQGTPDLIGLWPWSDPSPMGRSVAIEVKSNRWEGSTETVWLHRLVENAGVHAYCWRHDDGAGWREREIL